MYDALTVADVLLKLAKASGKSLTPMQLVKLTYISHGWSLALYNKDLFKNRIEAWKYGPVIPDLYQATKSYGSSPIPLDSIGDPEDINVSDVDKNLLIAILKKYGHLDGIALSYITHQDGTPWKQVYKDGVLNIEIPDNIIQEHYKELAKKA